MTLSQSFPGNITFAAQKVQWPILAPSAVDRLLRSILALIARFCDPSVALGRSAIGVLSVGTVVLPAR
jgi:hypothetical protein